jgi:acetyl esterase/lipase
VVVGVALGVLASSDGFAGAGYPAGTVAPQNVPAGQMSTVEYCRPDGVPLAMDLYMPPAASTDRPAPVAMYVHGGGLVLGDRKVRGLGAGLANHEGALFTPLQKRLNARGFVVASIDYRLAPSAPWPAQIEDAKCAVRFLRAHAAQLGIDPDRIGVWGSSGGGQLSSLLGLAGPQAGFESGQYPDESSAVQAVVDMFGPSDLNDFDDSDPFGRFIVQIDFGSSTALRRSASPITYVAPGAPPFLILQGTEDPSIRPHQSARLARRLHAAGVPATLIEVQGTGHGLTTPGQQPSPQELTATVIDFFTTKL